MSRFDEIKVGDVAELEHTVTKQDIERFVELTGDDNRLHIDAEYAAKTSFKKPVVHGMLGASFISTIIGTKLPGDGALWFAQNLEFLLPVRIGDHLTVRAEVLKKDERMQAVELQTDIFNQHRQKVTTGMAKVKVVEQEKATEAPQPLKHKVALVVGGSGGIGAAVCRALAKDGFAVAVHYFNNAGAAQKIVDDLTVVGQRRALAVRADISIEADVVNMISEVARKLGVPTVLVNCATSKIVPVKFEELIWGDMEQHISIAIKGIWNLTHHLVPLMISEGQGEIIQITTQSVEAPANDLLPYITAKSAIAGFCRALALDLAPKGIRVNMVSPGMTDTEQIAYVPERIRLLTAAKTPLRRLAKPEDVAGAVAFLASERADYLAGETIRVNGGQVML
jgi:3-oxoacyl-[acyl-carrier protein] reductase